MLKPRPPSRTSNASCGLTDTYVELSGEFIKHLSHVLLGPMEAIFLSVVCLWIVLHGVRWPWASAICTPSSRSCSGQS